MNNKRKGKSKYTDEIKKEVVEARIGGMSFKHIHDRWGVYASQVGTWARERKIDLKESCAKVMRKKRRQEPAEDKGILTQHLDQAFKQLEKEGKVDSEGKVIGGWEVWAEKAKEMQTKVKAKVENKDE